jgi:hypothetical protein
MPSSSVACSTAPSSGATSRRRVCVQRQASMLFVTRLMSTCCQAADQSVLATEVCFKQAAQMARGLRSAQRRAVGMGHAVLGRQRAVAPAPNARQRRAVRRLPDMGSPVAAGARFPRWRSVVWGPAGRYINCSALRHQPYALVVFPATPSPASGLLRRFAAHSQEFGHDHQVN